MPRFWRLHDDEEQQQQQPPAVNPAFAGASSSPKPQANASSSENAPLLVGGAAEPIADGPSDDGNLPSAALYPAYSIGYYRNHPRRVVRWSTECYYVAYVTLVSNYVNYLLAFVPLGIASGVLGWNSTLTFSLNFLAIVPLASLLSFATEQLSAELGQTLGGLLSATFGNAVELIVCIFFLGGFPPAFQKAEIIC